MLDYVLDLCVSVFLYEVLNLAKHPMFKEDFLFLNIPPLFFKENANRKGQPCSHHYSSPLLLLTPLRIANDFLVYLPVKKNPRPSSFSLRHASLINALYIAIKIIEKNRVCNCLVLYMCIHKYICSYK